jgi:hypothetical protein
VTTAPEGSPQGEPKKEDSPEEAQMKVEIKAAQARLQSLQQHNGAELEQLEMMGVQLDTAALTAIRLNSFISFVFQRLGSSSPLVRQMLAALFETEYQEHVRDTLKDVKSDVRKEMMAAKNVSKGDLQKMWAASNGGKVPPGFGGPG